MNSLRRKSFTLPFYSISRLCLPPFCLFFSLVFLFSFYIHFSLSASAYSLFITHTISTAIFLSSHIYSPLFLSLFLIFPLSQAYPYSLSSITFILSLFILPLFFYMFLSLFFITIHISFIITYFSSFLHSLYPCTFSLSIFTFHYPSLQ